jgi:hypothetical protein
MSKEMDLIGGRLPERHDDAVTAVALPTTSKLNLVC